MKYKKAPIDIETQILKLKSRDLLVEDNMAAEQLLQRVSYYRSRAYTYPFQDNSSEGDKKFTRKDIRIEDIEALYRFDNQLRSLLWDAIQQIEVTLRTQMALEYSLQEHSGFWFLQKELFFSEKNFNKALEILTREVQRSKTSEDFISHYYHKYDSPEFPPAWMSLEVVSMGTLGWLFSGLKKNNPANKRIRIFFGLPTIDILTNWIRSLCLLRNTCAHHSRLWNRRFTIGIEFPEKTSFPFMLKEEIQNIHNNKLFAYISVILYLLSVIQNYSTFKDDLLELLESSPKLADLSAMGFPQNWKSYSLWKI